MSQSKKPVFGILFGLLFLNILAWIDIWQLSQSGKIIVNFFDVGQGDAIFIESPKGHQILIDGGPDSAVLEKLSSKMPFWDRTIDLVILTHPEKDHLSGLIEVLKSYQVDFILWPGVHKDTTEFKKWEEMLYFQQEKGAQVFIAQAGQKIIGSNLILNIINPLESLEGQTLEDVNDSSVVLRLIFGENSFLFTGDISKQKEKEIIERNFEIDSDVLKVAHHGSKYSSDEEFIKRVSPKIAVISVGEKNSYGHPAPEVLEILSRYGIAILRTDQDGDIKITADQENFYAFH